jgi:hypothetical protein
MSALKRIPIKYVRDRAKSRYVKDSRCYVCDKDGSLDFHHLYTVDILFDNWLKDNKIIIKNAEDIIAVRDDFIDSHVYEMFEYARTLCKKCHQRLHAVYGQRPALATAEKQERWLDKQRSKRIHNAQRSME